MEQKQLLGECTNCNSSYHLKFVEEDVSQDCPFRCPFCGEETDMQEKPIEEDIVPDESQWD